MNFEIDEEGGIFYPPGFVESAARHLCRIRAVDPDLVIPAGLLGGRDRTVLQVVKDEVRNHMDMTVAMDLALKELKP